MPVEIKIPEVGESITEGVLVEWSVSNGALVAVEDQLLVLETDKITMNVTAENAGRLKILVAEGETVEVGQVVGTIDTEAAADGPAKPAEQPSQSPAAPEVAAAAPQTPPEITRLSPAVQRMVLEHAVDPTEIEGTGKDGRILKGDVIRFVESRNAEAEVFPTATTRSPAASLTPAEGLSPAAVAGDRQTRAPMSRLRQRLAERLVEVQHNAAILTTFNEADMTAVMNLRAAYKEEFMKRHGIGLGFMSFFVKGTVDALKTVPGVNAYIEGDEVVTNHYYDIGVAVSTDKGLVVPVIRDADRLTMAGIEAGIADLATRAQERRLELSDLTGAVFTISNGGVFGSLLSTPILNPPGSAILGMHSIQKRPVAVNDEVVIRPMMYLAMSYDHRIVDGREAVTFLKRVKECIENPERMMLEI
jgi:2-oxoglutarate dehydrogenase E2 component (dihydrolipoamide succinyltransferase)